MEQIKNFEDRDLNNINIKDFQELFGKILEIVNLILNLEKKEVCRCSDIGLKDTIIAFGNGGLGEQYRDISSWNISIIRKITMKILNKDL